MIKKFINALKYRLKRSADESNIDTKQLEELLEQGAILIDVRSPQEYQEGHLYDAICIPSYEIESVILTKIPNKEEKIILYCECGVRSKKAQNKLEKLGYKNVYNLIKE